MSNSHRLKYLILPDEGGCRCCYCSPCCVRLLDVKLVTRFIGICSCFVALPIGQTSMQSSSSLADELNAATGSSSSRPHLVLRKCHSRLRHEDSSPDSERMATDSGHSTAHSPENGPKSVSPIPCNTLQNTDSVSPSSTPGELKQKCRISYSVALQFRFCN